MKTTKSKKYKYNYNNCPKCTKKLHVHNCPGCGRSCACNEKKKKYIPLTKIRADIKRKLNNKIEELNELIQELSNTKEELIGADRKTTKDIQNWMDYYEPRFGKFN